MMETEAEEREKRLRSDLEQLRIQQEQTFGTLDTRIDATTEKHNKAIMFRLEGVLGNRRELKKGSPLEGG